MWLYNYLAGFIDNGSTFQRLEVKRDQEWVFGPVI